MAAKRAPFKVGDRVGFMPNGYSLDAGIILRVEQSSRTGSWRGDIRSREGDLINRSLHSDWVMKASQCEPDTIAIWTPIWERLEAQGRACEECGAAPGEECNPLFTCGAQAAQ